MVDFEQSLWNHFSIVTDVKILPRVKIIFVFKAQYFSIVMYYENTQHKNKIEKYNLK